MRVGPIPKFTVAFGTVRGHLSAQILEVIPQDDDQDEEELV
jgi:flagellar motor switch protein FliM